jgi:hypothetical protein
MPLVPPDRVLVAVEKPEGCELVAVSGDKPWAVDAKTFTSRAGGDVLFFEDIVPEQPRWEVYQRRKPARPGDATLTVSTPPPPPEGGCGNEFYDVRALAFRCHGRVKVPLLAEAPPGCVVVERLSPRVFSDPLNSGPNRSWYSGEGRSAERDTFDRWRRHASELGADAVLLGPGSPKAMRCFR